MPMQRLFMAGGVQEENNMQSRDAFDPVSRRTSSIQGTDIRLYQ
jgi:hypothetical protein